MELSGVESIACEFVFRILNPILLTGNAFGDVGYRHWCRLPVSLLYRAWLQDSLKAKLCKAGVTVSSMTRPLLL